MKLDYIGVTEVFNDPDEVIMAKLLAAHQAVRDINFEVRHDVEIQKLQRQMEVLKGPYKKRMLRQKSIINATELIARSRGLILPEDIEDDSVAGGG